MSDLIAMAIILSVYFIPILVILYFLFTTLHFFISIQNHSLGNSICKKIYPFLKTKIAFTIIGILYGVCIFIGMIFHFIEPSWFHPPVWLKIVSIVLFVPYLAVVCGLMGLGNIATNGFSPWKDFKLAIDELKKITKIAKS